MKRKSTACKIVQIILLVAIVMLLPTTVWAQETTLTTVVPGNHTMHLVLTGEGTIVVDGVAYTETVDVQVDRQHRPVISILAAEGSKIKTVLWGSEDFTTQFHNGEWTAPELIDNVVLSVVFEKTTDVPQTGDAFYPELWVGMLMLSLLSLVIALLCKKKYI